MHLGSRFPPKESGRREGDRTAMRPFAKLRCWKDRTIADLGRSCWRVETACCVGTGRTRGTCPQQRDSSSATFSRPPCWRTSLCHVTGCSRWRHSSMLRIVPANDVAWKIAARFAFRISATVAESRSERDLWMTAA